MGAGTVDQRVGALEGGEEGAEVGCSGCYGVVVLEAES